MEGERQGLATTDPVAGCLLPVAVDEVLVDGAGVPRLFVGRGCGGQRWLVTQVGEGGDARRWLCAPASDLAVRCLLSGRARPSDLFRHSATGSVEIVSIGSDGRLSESIRLCAELGHDEVLSELQLVS